MTGLSGKVAVVTGGGRGIGAAICRRLAADGALVAVHYGSSADAANEVVAAIESAGGSAFSVQAGLDQGDVGPLFAALDEELEARNGSSAIDVLVNNAGTTTQGVLAETTAETFDHLFAVNVRAPLLVAQGTAERMNDGGRIVGMSSSVTKLALPTSLVYSMTKAAHQMMISVLANELGPRGITVNSVAPGIIETEMVSGWVNASEESRAQAASVSVFNRVGEAAEVADVVSFLASEEARWVTGQSIAVNG